MIKLNSYYLLLLSITCTLAQKSPCPNIFQYERNGNEWTGIIRIRSSNFGRSIKLLLTMALEAELPNPNYVGDIVLADENREKVASTIVEGGIVTYKVLFPVPTPIPKVTSLLINNVEFCLGPSVVATASTPIVTTLRINHDVSVNVDNPSNNGAPIIQKPIPSHISPVLPTSTQIIRTDTNKNKNRLNVSNNKSGVDCGIAGAITNSLIIGGEETEPGEWPWLSALYESSKIGSLRFICSGSLISQNLIVTAAHCLVSQNKAKREVLVKLGIFNVFNWTEPHQKIIEVKETIIHPGYNTTYQHNDIALLKFPNVEYTQFIKPICIWSGDQNLKEVVGVKATVVGWGKDENNNAVVPEPKKAKATIVSTDRCLNDVPDLINFITDKTLCAGNRDGTGPCNGDSGGGLYVWRNRHWVLRGIVSNSLIGPGGETCHNIDYVLYTDTAKYLNWISNYMI